VDRVERSVRAVQRVAAWHGVRASRTRVIHDRANLLVDLHPVPVVARVPGLTALVRAAPEEFLAREVAVGGFAAAAGAPVVPPSDVLPPGPHACDGVWITFSRRVEVVDGPAPPSSELGRLLANLHEHLRPCPERLPYLTPLAELPRMIDHLAAILSPGATDGLRRAYDRDVAPLVERPRGDPRVLHGDSNLNNLVSTRDGYRWHDFEDAAAGPAAWDLACAARSPAVERGALVAGYGTTIDDRELDLMISARAVQSDAWLALMATRVPELREQARARLEALAAEP
jgi:hypothetical protein